MLRVELGTVLSKSVAYAIVVGQSPSSPCHIEREFLKDQNAIESDCTRAKVQANERWSL